METVLPHSEPYIPKAIVNGLISTVILWAFWTPFIVFLAIPLVAAQLKDGICMGLNDNYSIPQIPLKTNAYASQNLMNKDPQELKDANAKLTYTFIFTSVIVMTLCLYVAYRIIVGYNLDFKNILLFNIVMALIIVTIEMSFFTGVSMRYLPFIPTDVIGSVASDVSGYYNELTTATTTTGGINVSNAVAVPIDSDGLKYEIRWDPPKIDDSNLSYDVYMNIACFDEKERRVTPMFHGETTVTGVRSTILELTKDSTNTHECKGRTSVGGAVCISGSNGINCPQITVL